VLPVIRGNREDSTREDVSPRHWLSMAVCLFECCRFEIVSGRTIGRAFGSEGWRGREIVWEKFEQQEDGRDYLETVAGKE